MEGQFGKGFLIYCWKPVFSVILIMTRNLYFELALTERLTRRNCLVPNQHKCNRLLVPFIEVALSSDSVDVIVHRWFLLLWAATFWSELFLFDLWWFCVNWPSSFWSVMVLFIWAGSVWSVMVLCDLSWFLLILTDSFWSVMVFFYLMVRFDLGCSVFFSIWAGSFQSVTVLFYLSGFSVICDCSFWTELFLFDLWRFCVI